MCLPTFYRNIKFTGMIFVMRGEEEENMGDVKRMMAEEELREVKVVVIIINVEGGRGQEEVVLGERVRKRVVKEMEEESRVMVEVCNVKDSKEVMELMMKVGKRM